MGVWNQRSGTNLYQRQLARLVTVARKDMTTTSAMNVATARRVLRQCPLPQGGDRLNIMTWAKIDDEILPRFRAQPDGPMLPAEWSDRTQIETWIGPVKAEQQATHADNAVIVPSYFLQELLAVPAVKLTPIGASRGLEGPGIF